MASPRSPLQTFTGDNGLLQLSTPGPFIVGYQELELRHRPLGATAERALPVHAWYPAANSSHVPPADYSLAGQVRLPANALAAPAASAGPFPVAVYSHGAGGDGLLAYPYAERFASHGWVVLSPTHVGNSLQDRTHSTAETAVMRPLDISAALDQAGLGWPGSELEASVDLSRVFVFGHSFGAYAALAVAGASLDRAALIANCAGSGCTYLERPEVIAAFAAGFADARVSAIAAQAPTLMPSFRPTALAGLRVPTMLQSGDLDSTTPTSEQAAPAWAALDHVDDVWVRLLQGGHYSFITACHDLDPQLLAQLNPESVDDGCGPAFTPTRETVAILASYLLAFAKVRVLDQRQWTGILTGPAGHPAIAVIHR